VTYGEDGSKIWRRGSAEVTGVPIYKVKDVVDPTGCGDAFRAGVLFGLNHKMSIERAAHVGSWLASRAVTKAGTQNHRVSKAEFKKFLGMAHDAPVRGNE
ncbi:carbohydrate kinase family protein, partial [Candidatus Peregrinibacteria bacterium]|nr:carbohydrate kinase family protein [Candidatus Peregrinibacteria bacterium]